MNSGRKRPGPRSNGRRGLFPKPLSYYLGKKRGKQARNPAEDFIAGRSSHLIAQDFEMALLNRQINRLNAKRRAKIITPKERETLSFALIERATLQLPISNLRWALETALAFHSAIWNHQNNTPIGQYTPLSYSKEHWTEQLNLMIQYYPHFRKYGIGKKYFDSFVRLTRQLIDTPID
ncbi:MAG: hypothetical protein Q8P05_03995 [Candidatus Diapherotrites archaeon]|nr:hypothetical protein [Candidatus Diapherotrites archaeon]